MFGDAPLCFGDTGDRTRPEHSGKGHATYSSDLDIAILCDHTMSSDLKSTLISILARATGRPVDLVDLTRAGEPLLGEILKNGTRILSRDDSA